MNEVSFHHHPIQAELRRIRELADRLRDADAATPELFFDVMREACRRLPSVRRTQQFERFERLIGSGAWTDAALALLDLELPQWRLRQIAYDAGEWHCALSRQRELPDWLDQSVESRHADLALAILSAFLDAQRVRTSPAKASVPDAPRTDDAFCVRLSCDNFA